MFAHLPMILGPDGAKLSKRHGAVSVMQYREEGFLPEAVVNYLVRLGWAHGDQEIFAREQMIRLFDITDVNHSAAAINPGKLAWLNQHYLKQKQPAELVEELTWHLGRMGIEAGTDADWLARIVQAQQERAVTLREMAENSRFFFEPPAGYDPKAAAKHLGADAAAPLARIEDALKALQTWEADAIHGVVAETAETLGLKLGRVAQPIRVAVSGGAISPPIDMTLAILGREETLARLARAGEWIAANAARG